MEREPSFARNRGRDACLRRWCLLALQGTAGAVVLLLLLVASGSASGFATSAGTDSVVQDSLAAVSPAKRDVFDFIDEKILHRRVEPELVATTKTGIEWSLLPSVNYNPVYGLAIGLSASGGGWLGRGPRARPSAVSVSGSYSTESQLLLQARGDVYSPSGDYLVRADVRYLDTRRSTWGLGPIDPAQSEYPMSFNLLRVFGTVYRRVEGPLYIGLGLHNDTYSDIVDERASQGEATPFTLYSRGAPTQTNATAYSVNILGDTRDNLVNTKKGYYVSASFRDYSESLGSDSNWQEFLTEVRLYAPLPSRSPHLLAFWLNTWFTFGPAPYLDLPAIGWDTYGRSGRGYLQGRIRGVNQMYVESEYRRELTRDGLWGAVGFINLTYTTVPETQVFQPGDIGGGVGLRIKFNKRSDANLALDYGWGKDGSRGFFAGMTEVF